MEGLLLMKMPILQLLTVAFYLLSCVQVAHLIFLASGKPARRSPLGLAYEAALLAYLIAAALLSYAAMYNSGGLIARFWLASVPVEPLMWVSAAAFLIGIVVACTDRKPMMVPELTALFMGMPLLASAFADTWPALFIIGAALLIFRCALSLASDIEAFSSTATRITMVEAVKSLPEGVMYVDGKGKVVFMNDVMRSCLSTLGYPTDLGDARGLLEALRMRAEGFCPADAAGHPAGPVSSGVASGQAGPTASFKLAIPGCGVRFFSAEQAIIERRTVQRITAVDITEEDRLNGHLASVNAQLEAVGDSLRASMENLGEVEMNDARLHMRHRVHDVIGQRLSILHRFLDEDDLACDLPAQMAPLLASIIDDLDCSRAPDPADDLEAIVSAFGVIGVAVEVDGSLPESTADAQACIRVIREASTNAVRHAQAASVLARIEQVSDGLTLSVCNDGATLALPLAEGYGIAGMREAAEKAGGALVIDIGPPFTVRMMIGVGERAPAEREGAIR